MKKTTTRLAALALSLALLLTSCAGGASATTMHLRKTEGSVGVSDGEGKELTPKDNLGLYSGYQVETQAESYAWIDLDKVKLAKLDQDSEVEINKEGKKLEIDVKTGSLFFNVTEPLTDDETMNIATSTMLIGVRGTCGWVTDNTAALLEGTVSVTAGGQEATINAGEMAVLTEDGKLEVKPFTAASVPAFVREEIAEDKKLAADIQDTTGMDLTGADPMAPYADLLAKYLDEILYTEFVDFAGDGKPELLAIGIHINEDPGSPSYSKQEILTYILPDDMAEKPADKRYQVDRKPLMSEEYQALEEYRWSLVEADGRPFVMYYSIHRQQGSTPHCSEVVRCHGVDDKGNLITEQVAYLVDVRGDLRHSYGYWGHWGSDIEKISRDSDPGEFAAVQAKYREVKLLAHSPDGKSLVVDAG